MKRVLLIILIALVLVGLSFFGNNKEISNIEGFEINDEYFEGETTRKILMERGEDVIKFSIIDGVNEKSAENLIKTKVYTFEALYDREISPYPGIISDEIACGDEFIPKREETKEVIYYETFLSGRKTYGVCVDDLVEYKGVIGWTYCEKHKEYRNMEYIISKNKEIDLDFFLDNICNSI